MRRLRLVLLLAGTMLLAAGVVAGSVAQRSRSSRDRALTAEAATRAAIVQEYFDRARDIILLTAQDAAFARFYAAPTTQPDTNHGQRQMRTEINEALAYLQVLYRGSIGEACFIDGTGVENARVVGAHVAAAHELSPDESGNPFFKPTFALPIGQVYQATPYVSPDTGEWVISNSTRIPRLARGRAIVHFEVTVESMRRATLPADARFNIRILDRSTGRVITDSQLQQRPGAPLGVPGDRSMQPLLAETNSAGLVSLDGRRLAFTRLTGGDRSSEGPSPIAVNANDWVIVASTSGTPAAWSGPWAAGPVALTVAGLLALALAGAGYTRHHRQLHNRARTDDLTGLANRLRFLEQLTAACADPANPAAVLLLDLDRFKAVNDTLGHHAGDRLLVEVADRLRSTVAPGHLVARLGGDEFAVLIRQPADAEEPARVAARLNRAVRRTITLDGVPVAVSTSIGIARAPEHGTDPARLLRSADIAMYHAKRSAAGYTTYAEEQDTHSLAKLGLEAALLAAIEHRQLVLHYQPALDPATGQVHRVEALVRWQHPDLGLIPPNDFVPLAEETGLSHPLTRLVLEMALDQTAQWHAEGLALQVSVNLSPANCTDPQLPDEVAAMLAARNLPPAALRLEVTEHAALDPSAEQVLARLHHLGVSLALDDFGTGFSSLSHLRRLPVADIKIDRSFIAALADDPTDTVIIRSTIDIAHGLGCTVTAEGVEDEHTVHGLHRLGVDTIQGYHVCRPIPAGELRRWLQRTPQVRRTA